VTHVRSGPAVVAGVLLAVEYVGALAVGVYGLFVAQGGVMPLVLAVTPASGLGAPLLSATVLAATIACSAAWGEDGKTGLIVGVVAVLASIPVAAGASMLVQIVSAQGESVLLFYVIGTSAGPLLVLGGVCLAVLMVMVPLLALLSIQAGAALWHRDGGAGAVGQ
jgi:hypothetical protein